MNNLEIIKNRIKNQISDVEYIDRRINLRQNIIQIIFKSDILKNNKYLFLKINRSPQTPEWKYKYISTSEPRKTLKDNFIFKFRSFN